MRIGEQRPRKDGGTYVMTSARVMGNKRSADKRRGKRFQPLRVNPHAHPLVREFIDLLNASTITLTQISQRAAIGRCVITKWRLRSNPNIAIFNAALNAAGYELRIAKLKGKDAADD